MNELTAANPPTSKSEALDRYADAHVGDTGHAPNSRETMDPGFGVDLTLLDFLCMCGRVTGATPTGHSLCCGTRLFPIDCYIQKP